MSICCKYRSLSKLAYILVFILWICYPGYSFSQQSQADSLLINDHDEIEADELDLLPSDSLIGENEFLPGDIIFIPSDILYNNSWDNTYVRKTRTDLTQMEDTVMIVFNNPSESPFVFPRPGRFLSPYGYRGRRFHAGVDTKLEQGDTVVAAFDGKVRLAKRYKGYGLVMVIRHFNGLETVYAHLSKMLVNVNQDVKAGDPVGLGGRTGRATTTHLHFETRFLGEPFDPGTFIDFESFRLKSDTLMITGPLFERHRPGHAKVARHANGGVISANPTDVLYHKVKKGDTLGRIAKRYGTTVEALCRMNKLSRKSILRVGRHIQVR
ncbi:MAG TPA: peptidoglycan DD-metalloendopeptidase family protein [Bacteroidales bacterium]|nr:peptidoglycan DD-metalloendopeptidase family protein [Bacteroidales bacterium]HSA44278.1 peptidoglycan DD-metalloendopeptidase family protein [Bacteroidales bacterium]